jgi:hypothetical protein
LTAILCDPACNSSAQNRENPRNGWISERDASILRGCFSILWYGAGEVRDRFNRQFRQDGSRHG